MEARKPEMLPCERQPPTGRIKAWSKSFSIISIPWVHALEALILQRLSQEDWPETLTRNKRRNRQSRFSSSRIFIVQTPARAWKLDSSNRAMTCPRDTPGKPSRKSSMDYSASRWSNKPLTGTRVPAKTASPPRISGSIPTTFFMPAAWHPDSLVSITNPHSKRLARREMG